MGAGGFVIGRGDMECMQAMGQCERSLFGLHVYTKISIRNITSNGHVFCGNQYKYKYTGLNIEIVRERAPGKEQSVWETEASLCGGQVGII